ncbi:hypothetical protein JW752_02780 [Candidatus Peregrinibacteria bacterium]|nr:hypothetical protein [Candidatus Peregrinibacteria bacterium]
MAQLKTTPKDVFLQLLMLVTLYISVISLITLSFSYINYWFPDALDYYPYGLLDGIRVSSSMLIVAFPLLLFLSWLIQKDLRKNPKKHELKFRKWLVYLTLLIAAITIIIDLIQLVNSFYGGELTLPFTLKVLSVLILTGGVFGYYIWDVQHEPHKSKIPAMVAWGSSVLVLIVLALGFLVAGSPTHQREVRMDERRVSDLQMLQSEIINYWQMKEALPPTIDALKNELSGFLPPTDPDTEMAYEYTILEPLKFELCATFSHPNPFKYNQSSRPVGESYYYYKDITNEIWDHEAGRECFERTIDPELYPKPTGVLNPIR